MYNIAHGGAYSMNSIHVPRLPSFLGDPPIYLTLLLFLRDLAFILSEGKDIVNKFRTDQDPFVTQCLVEIQAQKYSLQ